MAPRKKKPESDKKKKLGLGDLGAALGDQLPPGDDSPSEQPLIEVLDPLHSPLQVLITESFHKDNKGNELAGPVLTQVARAERGSFQLTQTAQAEKGSCQQLYQQLCDRTELIADEVITVRFPWRLRVGGTRGFRELILPVFHPVYGVPYVPSSSLKGFLRAWARKTKSDEFKQILGFIEGEDASLARVQILDAFPTKPCLKLDMANPQWKWDRPGKQVTYGTVPHPLLSMAEVTLKIGIVRTSLGTVADVATAKAWLEQAFQAEGLGARVSAGYGQASRINGKVLSQFSSVTHPHGSEHPFEFWSEGIHGADARNNREFRPVAVRGVLRYWFRAVALGLYAPDECRALEQKLFGGIEPEPQEGSFKLMALLDEEVQGDQLAPHHGTGKLILQPKEETHLELLQGLLKLAFHIGGIGRGARRPLHANSGRLRGCFWQPTATADQLPYESQAWQDALQSLMTAFEQIMPINRRSPAAPQRAAQPNRSRPARPQRREQTTGRLQDIFNENARIFLVPSPQLKHPQQVKNWRNEGDKYPVRGTALEFFYNSGFKGGKQGNAQVGGNLGTPSYVWIQSNGLDTPTKAYQVITLFGVDHSERAKFLQAIEDRQKLKEKIEITLPW
jgi:CRISPR-associated protein Cmr6